MTEEITPALTPDEWRLLQLWKVGKMPGGKVRGMAVLDLPESHVHGAAACALFGEPFGFTQEDVEWIRARCDDVDDERIPGESLASRIAALLPPAP